MCKTKSMLHLVSSRCKDIDFPNGKKIKSYCIRIKGRLGSFFRDNYNYTGGRKTNTTIYIRDLLHP